MSAPPSVWCARRRGARRRLFLPCDRRTRCAAVAQRRAQPAVTAPASNPAPNQHALLSRCTMILPEKTPLRCRDAPEDRRFLAIRLYQADISASRATPHGLDDFSDSALTAQKFAIRACNAGSGSLYYCTFIQYRFARPNATRPQPQRHHFFRASAAPPSIRRKPHRHRQSIGMPAYQAASILLEAHYFGDDAECCACLATASRSTAAPSS
jgi:hypothetical protein